MLPVSAARMSSRVAPALIVRRCVTVTTMPGNRMPHWTGSQASTAAWSQRAPTRSACEPLPTARERLDRADRYPHCLNAGRRIKAHREADDCGRIIAGLSKRQAGMGGLAISPRQDDPREQPARLECRSDLEEALQADPLLIASAGDFDFGIEAEQCGHAVCRGESRCREITADGRDRADRRIGGAAGCRRKDVEFG